MLQLIIRRTGSDAEDRRIVVQKFPATLGRDEQAEVPLEDVTVSRRHARILHEAGKHYIEDLGSRNGLVINGKTLRTKTELKVGDNIKIGNLMLQVAKPSLTTTIVDREHFIQAQVSARFDNPELFTQQAPQRLQAVLELSRQLSTSLEPQVLFDKLLEHLLVLFPRADRGTVIVLDQEELLIKSQRSRLGDPAADFPISGTIVRAVLEKGIGILSQDVLTDPRFAGSRSLQDLQWRSVLCVPLISPAGRKLGAVQIASAIANAPFQTEELHLLTTLAMQAAVVLENLMLQAERLQEMELRKELALAREIQQSYLPSDFTPLSGGSYRLYACVTPAREVSGDLYDFFPTDDGRLAFFLGDVSGKGMPAALFMVAVHALGRNLAVHSRSPAATLENLNTALVRDNQAGMFVTLLHGLFDPRSGEIQICNAGHMLPLLRTGDNQIREVTLPTGSLLGFEESIQLSDTRLVLAPGETLILYTDGITEAPAPRTKEMFGLERLQQVLVKSDAALPLEEQAEMIRRAVFAHTDAAALFDDLTLLFLQRSANY